jgi:hypothetical protein
MGVAKRLLEAQEAKHVRAMDIAIKARVLRVCEHHDEVFLSHEEEIVGAYKLGNARFQKDSLGETFDNRREMTDYIKEVVDDAAVECWQCARLRDE